MKSWNTSRLASSASVLPPRTGTVDARRRGLVLASGMLVAPALLMRAAASQGLGRMGPMMNAQAGAALLPARPFQLSLPNPPQLRGDRRDGVLHFALSAQAGVSELVAGVRTPTWGYNGSMLGPALVVPRAQPVRVEVRNGLAQSTTLHWHGAIVPGAADGGPHSPIQAGGTQRVGFTLDQPGATLWFHPHPDTRTGAQAYSGLAGLLLVDDGVDRRLGLPHTWGVDDIPVIVQDRRIAADGTLLYMTSMHDLMGMKGDRFLVNGCEQPYVAVPAQHVRLRLLNGSNARIYNFAFDDGRAFQVVASDAGLLARPAATRRLLLAPGERAEIVVDLSGDQGRQLVLQSRSAEVVDALTGSPMDSDAWDQSTIDLLQLRVGAPSGAKSGVPAKLAEIDPLAVAAARVRRFTLQGMRMGSMMGGPRNVDRGAPIDSGPGGMSLGVGGQNLFSINDQFMQMNRIDQRVRLGDVEIWELRNEAHMAHPIHVHGVSYQVLSRDGASPPEWERGRKDTVLVRGGETVRLAMRFTQRADEAHPYMYHCHILEHEGNGMMGQFTVL
ncbi:putative multicopper oxidase [Thiomonas arsenitoxydans]|uniref:multicopper oxidase family protein n=1 Tax=Thiomonas TaxID=32012 RepID=UPI0007C2D70F|nr:MULTISPECIES: multicopper oxidase domain-containing protein [Thiomonas]CQR29381.1 putative multicopper oxidase [Thiomonas arsenitoxydans]